MLACLNIYIVGMWSELFKGFGANTARKARGQRNQDRLHAIFGLKMPVGQRCIDGLDVSPTCFGERMN